MHTKKLEGPAKFAALALTGMASEIESQEAGTIQVYAKHETEVTYVALVTKTPYSVDLWEATGTLEQREDSVQAIVATLPAVYAAYSKGLEP